MKIILVRHGESLGNVFQEAHLTTPDWRIPLTRRGVAQAQEAAQRVAAMLDPKLPTAYRCSPFVRAIDTAKAFGADFVQDPRIREQDYGRYKTLDEFFAEDKERIKYGTFFYRITNGESGADVYDRCLSFVKDLEASKAKQAVIVTHGFALRILLMIFLKWDVTFFEKVRNPKNCEIHIVESVKGGYELKTELSLRAE